MKKVTVFGSFVVDLMTRSLGLPVPGETIRGSIFKMGAGGKGFNQGVAAYKAGADVCMVTKLGKDTFADVALSMMDDIKMDHKNIFFSEDIQTGVALILVDEKTSQNEIVVVPGACDQITVEEVNSIREVLKQSEYVLIQLEVNQDANEAVVDIIREYGGKVILNPAPYQPVSDEFLSKIFLITPNEVEAEQMTGIKVTDMDSAMRAAAVLEKKGIKQIIITMGSRGVFVSADGKSRLIPCCPVNAVDTTGAGDAFNGGLLTGLAEGMDIWEAAEFANALAGLSVQKYGTAPAMPWREEIDQFRKRIMSRF